MKNFSISIDCEDLRENSDGHCNLYDCKVRDGSLGIPKLMEIFEQQGVKATFFVDVYNVQKRISSDSLRSLCKQIVINGHEIGLHTHPNKIKTENSHLFDSPVGYLADYPRSEQFELLDYGKKCLEDWTGVAITTHRGGSYSISKFTFELLSELGFKTDASIFWPASDYSFVPLEKQNLLNPFMLNGIIEVPVSCFLSTFLAQRLSVLKKIDINWSTKSEILKAQKMIKTHVDIFLHSYSLFRIKKHNLNSYFTNSLIIVLNELKKERKNITFNQIQPAAEVQSIPTLPAFSSLISYDEFINIYFPKMSFKKIKTHFTRARAITN
jgi:hypothetical protein